jgi:hypothetical protein
MSKDLHAAVLAIQSEIGTLQKNAINPHFKSRYISLDSLVEHVQPLLTKHGLIWTTAPDYISDSDSSIVPALSYQLTHAESGGTLGGSMPLLLEKQNAQGLGSAITYARRYALCAVLNIVADVDDDGEKATKQAKKLEVKDFASKVRETGMKGNDIKAYLMAEEGFDNDYFQGKQLTDILNKGLDGDKQDELLAWARG